MTTRPRPPSTQSDYFWKTKTLEEMSDSEWESLCDGCARCCLEKLEDEDTGQIYFTHISCTLLDAGLCACKDYPNRSDKVSDCVRLTPENVRTLNWLPPSCGYKLVAEGRGPVLVASADFRRSEYGSRGRCLGPGKGLGHRGRGRGGGSRGPYRAVAGLAAEARTFEKAACVTLIAFSGVPTM